MAEYDRLEEEGRMAPSWVGLPKVRLLPQIRLGMECEPEAWLYALTVWGILTGDHSYAARKTGKADEGYILA
jgi:hypothetical protein